MTPDSPARSGVLCAGSVVVDAAKVIDGYPGLDGLAVIESVSLSAGGPALNLAMDLALLGAPFPLAVTGVIGADLHGDLVRDTLRRNGIDVSGLRRTAAAVTSFTDAMIVRDRGRRTFFHHVGANALLTPADVDLDSGPGRSARILHLGAPGLHPGMDDGGGWPAVLAAGQARGLHTNLELVSLAPERLQALVRPCLPHLDSLVVNELEACAVAGLEPPATGPDDDLDWPVLEQAAGRLVAAGVRQLVAVHFPYGAVAVTGDGTTYRQGSVRLPVSEIANATGAGDAFAAGVIYGVHEGWPVPDCLRFGVCAAAAGLRGGGTHDGVAPMADCLALGERHGFRAC